MTSPHDTPGAPGRDAVTGAPVAVSGSDDAARPLIRPARPDDVPQILAMVRELAEFERSAHEVRATEDLLTDLLFGTNTPGGVPAAHCHVAEVRADGAATPLLGMALWFLNASTWEGRHGVYLEDLYVRPAARGQGIGQALMAELAQICVERGYARLEWWVLDWNTHAIDFYQRLGSRAMDEWTVHRITGPDLEALARRSHDE